MRVCYLIQTHKNPQQIYRLINLIQTSSPECQIVISHDPTFCELDLSIFPKNHNIHLFFAKGGRADFSMVQSYLDALHWLLKNQIDFDWLINISGQDYPIKPIPEIEAFLATTNYDGFLEYFDVLSSASQWSIHEGHSRYFYQYQQLSPTVSDRLQKILKPLKILNYIQPWIRFNCSYDIRIGFQGKTPFNAAFKCYGGSFFTTLSRQCAEYIDNYANNNPNFIEYCRRTSISVEFFMQTILINSQLFNLCNDCKRYFDFTNSQNGSPNFLTQKDYESLAKSQAHFARKFDLALDPDIFDLIDRHNSPNQELIANTYHS
ncbi:MULTISPECIES: beta-1,6-N-acetylglucosaminyltransferase [Calothrix]|uniref:Peptide O-xylosyltransferase n=2 Tax=Calothrix TaxID=1186 RepID=A0ABR8A6C6_9CYAN|nr:MULTISPECIES: beta-1,6-N-acetylglucosaminyltransferase [Calothrix]MBD2194377.1 N-acetylglucosaminyltransferase [Calothrix parietina FACHB-288]MBD2223159.1 N-acetylglucosaminyltransferase [Calothrix anomala FACHB-343]